MAMRIEIVTKKWIKPSIPTPPPLRHYRIASTDELHPPYNISIILLFQNTTPAIEFDTRITQLESSLGKTLTTFRPLAGRYMSHVQTVDCNDSGAEFVRARADVQLSHILHGDHSPQVFEGFTPLEMGAADQITDPLLGVQVTEFQCGGLALSVCISHRVADASTLATFLNDWAALNRSAKSHSSPGFNGDVASFFPGRGQAGIVLGFSRRKVDVQSKKLYVSKRFSFGEDMISKLGVHDEKGRPWPKGQLVSSVIWKALMGIDRARTGCHRPSVLFQPMNVRERTTPPIPKNTCGNLVGIVRTECCSDAHESSGIELKRLAGLLSDSVKKNVEEYAKLSPHEDGMRTMVLDSFSQMVNIPDSTSAFWISSWRKFPFYEADFGWGKPVWVTMASMPIEDTVYLLDRDESVWREFLWGAIAGGFGEGMMHPIDTIKTRIQSQAILTECQSQKSIVQKVKSVWVVDGLRGFYRGVVPGVAGSLGTGATYFGVIESTEKWIEESHPNLSGHWAHFIAGAIGDTLGSFIYVPCEVMKQRMQVQGTRKYWSSVVMKDSARLKSGMNMYGYYSGMFQAGSSIWKEQGPKGLYAGYWSTLARDVPFAGLMVTFYEALKDFTEYGRRNWFPSSSLQVNSSVEGLLLGGIAGGLSAFLTTPLDVIKTRLQVQGTVVRYKGWWDALDRIWMTEGPKGMFRGSIPRVVWYVSASALTFMAVEFLRDHFNKRPITDKVEDITTLSIEKKGSPLQQS